MRVAVAGGSGTAGRLVVEAARARGHDVVAVSRSQGQDVTTGSGVRAALASVDVVVDALNSPSTDAEPARRFFATAAGVLTLAASENDVRRIVCLSIVGIDRAPGYGYYAAKLAQEEAYRAGPVPVTVVRTTQWHEFVDQLVARTRRGPVVAVPSMRVRTVAASAAAEALVDAATAQIAGSDLEVCGPEEAEMTDLVRQRLRGRGERALVVPVPFPGAAQAVRDGALLPGPGARVVGPTFDEWAAQHP